MLVLSNFATLKSMNIAGIRNVDDYENMSRQEPENIFTTPSASIRTLIPIYTPRSRPRQIIRYPSSLIPRPRLTSGPLPNVLVEVEKYLVSILFW